MIVQMIQKTFLRHDRTTSVWSLIPDQDWKAWQKMYTSDVIISSKHGKKQVLCFEVIGVWHSDSESGWIRYVT